MGDECRRRLSHRLTEFCVFLNVIFAVDGTDFVVSNYQCGMFMFDNMYIGTRNVTHSGKACKPWTDDSISGAAKYLEDDMFSDGSKEAAENFCRNPDIREADGLWCYTTDPDTRWEYCNVCPGQYELYNGCELPDRGEKYQGDINVTQSLTPCQHWSEFPNKDHRFPEGSAKKAGNYCRNPTPNITPAPWCYISGMGSKTWEYCEICRPFQGKVTVKEGFYTQALERLEDMSIVACIHWCITYGSCVGVVVGTYNECLFFTRLGGASLERVGVRTYFVSRVCSPLDGGKKFHYVKVQGVEPIHFPNGYEELSCDKVSKCDDMCSVRKSCIYYWWHTERLVFVAIDKLWKYLLQRQGTIVLRIKIRCESSLKGIEYTDESPDIPDDSDEDEEPTPSPTIPVVTPPPSMSKVKEKEQYEQLLEDSRKAQLRGESTLKPAKEETGLSTPIMVGIAVAVVFALAAVGFAYYKIVYKKRTYKAEIKAQEKAKVRANLKKPGDKGEKTESNPKKSSAHKNVTANNKKSRRKKRVTDVRAKTIKPELLATR